MTYEKSNLKELILKALFCKINIFKERANSSENPFEQYFTYDEYEKKLIEDASYLAGWSDTVTTETQTKYLTSVFSKVSLTRDEKKEYNDCWAYYDIDCLKDTPLYPSQDTTQFKGDYKKLWNDFINDYNHIGKDNLTPQNALILLERYTSFIPIKEVDRCDISLFDHARMTAAIASCIHLADENNKETKPFVLFGGDFSGVQNFIYTITSKGALKTLRARSFYLEILTEHIIYEIFTKYGLSTANVIFSGGGRFTLLLPNNKGVLNYVEKVINTINEEINRIHGAKLYVVYGHIPFSRKDVKENISEIWRGIGGEISKNKSSKYTEFILRDSKFFEPLGRDNEVKPTDGNSISKCERCNENDVYERTFTDEFSGEKIFGCNKCLPKESGAQECQICHRYTCSVPLPPPASAVNACIFCANLYHVGEHLHQAKYVVRRRVKNYLNSKGYIKIGEVYYQLVKDSEEVESLLTEVETLWVINSIDIKEYNRAIPVYPLFIGTYPNRGIDTELFNKKENEILLCDEKKKEERQSIREFKALSCCATGTKRLATLRMDVDSLGDISTRGLLKHEKNLTRISAISRHLTLFFKFYLNQIMKGEGFPLGEEQTRVIPEISNSPRYAVIVYSGGDDLFIVGAWNDVVELAHDIRKSFKKYTSDNHDINISGGFVVMPHDYPLYKMAELAGEAEKKAKEQVRGKDALTLFYGKRDEPSYKWDGDTPSVAKIVDFVTLFNETFKESVDGVVKYSCPTGFIYELLQISELKKKKGKIYLPKLAYTLSRRGLKGNNVENFNKCLLDQNKGIIDYLYPVMVWVKLLNRR